MTDNPMKPLAETGNPHEKELGAAAQNSAGSKPETEEKELEAEKAETDGEKHDAADDAAAQNEGFLDPQAKAAPIAASTAKPKPQAKMATKAQLPLNTN